MFVGVSRIELHISASQSLKDKRRIIKSLAQKISRRFNVSVSEVDHHDLWQRGTLAVAHVAANKKEVEKLIHKITDYAENNSEAEVVRCTYSFFNPEKDF
ncbi:MAG TPA: DUF503 domain-containing protein [Actinobacteria bacterium]|nr:DUF503 domain-containing protein [Actinomycetes bacterium]HEX21169.1 DUF503 domain-containing protein [Actinomycetota bacterium]